MTKDRVNLILQKWSQYFPSSETPIGIFYSDELHGAEDVKKPAPNPHGYTCIFAQMSRLHKGQALAFSCDNLGCWGSINNIFDGPFCEEATVNLLCNIEKFKKDADGVLRMRDVSPKVEPHGKYLIMKPLNLLTEEDEPEIFLCFAKPDTIAALHSLACFDDSELDAVMTPFGSGCEMAIKFALAESRKERPRCVLGGMDVAMRACLKADVMTFSIPAKRFQEMVDNMDISFLDTYIWKGLKNGQR